MTPAEFSAFVADQVKEWQPAGEGLGREAATRCRASRSTSSTFASGVVAAGMRVEVFALVPNRRQIAAGQTGKNGQLEDRALSGRLAAGAYEAVFHVADWYREPARCAARGAVPRRRRPTASASPIRSSTTTCRSSARRGAIRASAAAPDSLVEAYLLDWLTLLARWAHIVVGIAWIGASFYFIWLDNHLEAREDRRTRFRRRALRDPRRRLLPRAEVPPRAGELPKTLHWFKWEAYWTWITGFALLVLVYYLNAELYLIDPQVTKLSPGAAIGIGLASLVVGLVVYEGLCRAPLGETGLALALLVVFALAAWGLTQVFSGRGAFIHFGAILGTIMAANVAHVIIPGQRELVRAKQEGREPDPKYAIAGKAAQRAQHVLHAAGDLHHDLRPPRDDLRPVAGTGWCSIAWRSPARWSGCGSWRGIRATRRHGRWCWPRYCSPRSWRCSCPQRQTGSSSCNVSRRQATSLIGAA